MEVVSEEGEATLQAVLEGSALLDDGLELGSSEDVALPIVLQLRDHGLQQAMHLVGHDDTREEGREMEGGREMALRSTHR